jgi:hypothetical protein
MPKKTLDQATPLSPLELMIFQIIKDESEKSLYKNPSTQTSRQKLS